MTDQDITPAADPRTLGFATERLARIHRWMQRYVDEEKIPFASTLIARRGQVAYHHHVGARDIETGAAFQSDDLLRFYSMTKPVTSVALMMLYEQGLFHLDDPVESFIPEFANRQVLIPGAERLDQVAPAKEVMTVHHLLTHRSGLTYGFIGGELGEAYVKQGVDFAPGAGALPEVVTRLADLPLLCEPGSRWNYSVSTDVVGRLVEIISGQTLDAYFAEHILGPLGMNDTAFDVPDDKIDRFCACYLPGDEDGMKLMENAVDSAYREGQVTTHSGGGGLLSTMPDYLKFADMLRQRGRVGDDRLLGPRTVDYMTANHLDSDIAAIGPKTFAETSFEGVGFGLGVWSMLNPQKAQIMGSPGDFGWGGMASTAFWVDPELDMIVIFLTQLVPSSQYPMRKELRALVHQAIVD